MPADPTPADARALAEEAIRLAEAATPGPWEPNAWYGTEEGGWCGVGPHINDSDDEIDDPDSENCARANRDAALIAHAGTHYATLARALLAALDEREAMVRAARNDALTIVAKLFHSAGKITDAAWIEDIRDEYPWDGAAIARLEARIK